MAMPPRRYSAPEPSGARLIDPPVVPGPGSGSIEALVDNNRLLRAALDVRIGDMRLWELVAATRREVLMVASEYTGHYRHVDRPADVADWIARPIIMAAISPNSSTRVSGSRTPRSTRMRGRLAARRSISWSIPTAAAG